MKTLKHWCVLLKNTDATFFNSQNGRHIVATV